MTQRIRIALATLLLLSTAALVWTQTSTALVLLHTNDIHGQLLPRNGEGGLAELATVIRRERPDLLLDGGDMFTGTMISDESYGKPIIEVLNRLNYAAVALGNHEFDYGMEELQKRAKEARFPILSANVRTNIGEIKPFTIVNVKDVRIGIVGLTVEALAEVTHPKHLKNVTVLKLADALQENLPKLRGESDFIVMVSHLTFDEQIRVAKAFPEIRLIVTGHPHQARATHVGSTLIVETGSSARNVGKVQIRLSGKAPDSMTAEMISVRDVPADPEIQAIIEPYRVSVMTRAAHALGEIHDELRKSETEESALQNMITDALREHAKAQVGIQNIGGIRAGLRKGQVTYGDVFDVLPFQNTLVKMTMTGSQLKQVLGRRVVAVSGLKVSWDTTKPSPNRLVSATLADGSPIVDSRIYTVAVNDFVAAGGDGLLEFTQGAQVEDTGVLLREVVSSYIRTRGIIGDLRDGRVTIKTR